MYNAEFEVEALTPIFMRGADQREAEIRASSIKGVIRWWFRALAGNYFGDDIKSLREAENYAFGSTSGRSRAVVSITDLSKNLDERLLPMARGFRQKTFAENTSFSITLQSHDELAIKLACISTWAMIILGGIGARHTRGAGSLMIKNIIIRQNFNFDLNYSFNNLHNELPSEIDKAISKIKDILKQNFNLKPGHKAKNTCLRYSALTPECARVYLLKNSYKKIYYESNGFSSPRSLMDDFENVFKKSKVPSGYRNFIFGLPRGNVIKRRMSPMHVGAIKTDTGAFLKIVVLRTNEFYPNFNGRVSWNVIDTFLKNELGATKIWGY
ncbi:MAG: type III-B CRISPR module RAMP protein Cmr1 [Methanophagales archaeon]|nr:type III-B CRISPR module RAMP protein Cmr1 [Methanophagales archaeon]